MEKVTVAATKIMNFLNLLDGQGRLSVSNLSVFICLLKLAMSPTTSLTDTGALFMALSNYAYKRYSLSKDSSTDNLVVDSIKETTDKLTSLESAISNLQLKVGLK